MNPAKITIEGDYWDCQIYRGRLYLFLTDGSTKVIDWPNLVNTFIEDEYFKVAIKYSFLNGSVLYDYELNDLLLDNEVRNILHNKFEALIEKNLEISEEKLNEFVIEQQNNPFNELQNDTDIFNNKLYGLTHNSLLSASIHTYGLRYPISTKPKKLFDIYGFTCKANNYSRLAISAGSDGLIEFNASKYFYQYSSNKDERARVVTPKHSSFSDYSFLSLYNSSLEGESCLAFQKWDTERKTKKSKLVKIEDISEERIFNNNHENQSYVSWGHKEKIYRAIQGGIQMVRFNNYAEDGNIFTLPKFIPLQDWKGKVISAATAYYGTILHCENTIVVMKSDGTFYNIPGEITRFRIYPRSINYANHLHVIHDDRIEIYSFNNDYFVPRQIEKDFGIAFKFPKFNRRSFVPDDVFYDLDDDEENGQDNNDNNPLNPLF